MYGCMVGHAVREFMHAMSTGTRLSLTAVKSFICVSASGRVGDCNAI